jgi:hypothetical protein
MLNARKVIARLVGWVQCVLGGLASTFAFLVYASTSFQEALAVTGREVALYMFLFSILGILLVMSGLLLLREQNGEH